MPQKKQPKKGAESKIEIPVSARLLGAEDHEEAPRAVAYAFDAGGRLLDRKKLSKEGDGTLTVPVGEEGRAVRVIVGGETEEKEVTASELLHRGGEERMLRLRPGARLEGVELLVPDTAWLCWWLSRCLVRGTILKRYERDGVQIDAPVCNAEVEIFEVDPWYLVVSKLPEYELERIRDLIIDPKRLEKVIERPRKRPEPGPIPPIGELELSPAATPASRPLLRPGEAVGFNPQPEPPAELIELPRDLRLAARSASVEGLRAALADYPDFGRLILCRYWPRFVTLQSLGKVKTDACGRFQKLVYLGCNNRDTPDLYFRAKQKLFGFLDVEIYAPTPIACHTRWNYQCGTEITLYTKHPLAQTCAPCPGVNAPTKWVLAMAIGNTRLDRIYGIGPDLQPATTSGNRGMLAPSGSGGHDRPFGGLCRLRLEFDSTDLRNAGIRYYRVGWREAGSTADPVPLTGSIVRHYHKEVGDDLVLKVYPLGPNTVPITGTSEEEPNLYEIPPALPPEGNWSLPDVVEDTTNAKFVTHALPPAGDPGLTEEQELLAQAGKYELVIDLFDADGKQVDVGVQNVNFRVPDGEDSEGNVDTEDAATLGLVQGDSLVLPLHVDNNRCTAEIHSPSIGSVTASPSCGVMPYDEKVYPNGETVTMPFTAGHPNGHATYSFTLKRGIEHVDSIGGKVPGGTMTKQINDALLGPCRTVTGGVAAYAEHLHVDALATNGWSTLNGYDAGDVAAFVLTPDKPGGGP